MLISSPSPDNLEICKYCCFIKNPGEEIGALSPTTDDHGGGCSLCSITSRPELCAAWTRGVFVYASAGTTDIGVAPYRTSRHTEKLHKLSTI
ncbi:hypothetical protein PILCRDRAFT_492361 [Piloderma croceum F 1598]|uniref:Uncharacterized protein n=1 Tax=Piloderma croceum (strain F 1598) TaxID=765440 RepID=A0A0C3FRU1_PILCF|nr:hypothetical protein PILCRDRAFT_492361 [Piloderma croceum F 1598]